MTTMKQILLILTIRSQSDGSSWS